MAAASQIITATTLDITEINCFIRGYHAYMDVWEPTLEILLAKPEPTTVKDENAVAVFKEELLVGHVPFNPLRVEFLTTVGKQQINFKVAGT